jgi:putative ABC transport system permease protein
VRTGAITLLPMSGLLARVPFTVDGRPIERERIPYAQYRTVTPGYFEAARIPLKRGRTFSESDTGDTRAVAVISEALAAQWLEGMDPIGARLLVDDNDTGARPIEIIGVVGSVRQLGLDTAPTHDLYLTYTQVHRDNVGAAAANMFWILRVASPDPMLLAPAVTREVRAANAGVAASQVRPLTAYLADAVAPRRFSVTVMVIFSMAALLLATTGVYAVVSYATQQQAREIAIRMALGARVGDIARLVVAQGLKSVVTGLLIGAVMALAVMRTIASLLFELTPFDLSTFAQVLIAVGVVSALACAAPIARTRKDVSWIVTE